jgi:hypothetical protein
MPRSTGVPPRHTSTFSSVIAGLLGIRCDGSFRGDAAG